MNRFSTVDPLPRQIYLTAQRLQIHADKALQPFSITLEQLRPLKILHHSGGAIAQRRLCELAEKTPANMTRILDRLVAKDLVERKPNPDDRRAFTVVMTKNGKELIRKVEDLFTAFLHQVLAGISEKDETACRKVLDQITRNLADMIPENAKK